MNGMDVCRKALKKAESWGVRKVEQEQRGGQPDPVDGNRKDKKE